MDTVRNTESFLDDLKMYSYVRTRVAGNLGCDFELQLSQYDGSFL